MKNCLFTCGSILVIAVILISLFFLLLVKSCESEPRPPMSPAKLKNRISNDNLSIIGDEDKFLVMICGKDSLENKKKLSLAYQIFLENGGKRKNVYILADVGKRIGYYPVTDLASKKSVAVLFNHLKKKIDKNDFLFVYLVSESEKNNNSLSIILSYKFYDNETLHEEVLLEMLNAIPNKTGVFFADLPYAESFIEKIGKGNFIGISTSKINNKEIANVFTLSFFKAFRNIVDADINSDGKVSIREAFDFAKKSLYSKNITPQYVSEIDGNNIFISK